MNLIVEKVMVGILGLMLFTSVMVVGIIDARHRMQAKAEATPRAVMNPQLDRGREVFEKFSCVSCHGIDGKGGISNYNAQTAQLVPPLTYVADSYSKAELSDKILHGVRLVEKLDANGPTPPLYMPAFKGIISDQDLDLLIGYLNSLMPKKSKDSW